MKKLLLILLMSCGGMEITEFPHQHEPISYRMIGRVWTVDVCLTLGKFYYENRHNRIPEHLRPVVKEKFIDIRFDV